MNTKSSDTFDIPLLVDLDGSLLKSDTLFETAMLVLSRQPWLLFMMVVWLLQGKQALKSQLATRCQLDVETLPYNHDVIAYCEQQAAAGRKIILCTGSWYELAERIATRFKWIGRVAGTDHRGNLTGHQKAQWAVAQFGEQGFDYLGNSGKDLLVWKHARQAIVVGSHHLVARARAVTAVVHHIIPPKLTLKICLKAIRIHQWAKNSLVFVPLITAHQWHDQRAVLASLLAFLCLSLVASATYLLNDLFDLDADRRHGTKRNRPLAAGLITIPQAVALGIVLMSAALLLCWFLTVEFLIILMTYLVFTVAYSFKLKRLQSIDVLVLAGLFTIRVIAGAAAINVVPSFWLLSFSMFIFLSLAVVKRVTELIRVEKEAAGGDVKIRGRGYFTADIVILQSLGGSSGFLSVLVFALYINSAEVTRLYRHPELLWLMCPILGYWIMRIWMLTARNEMEDDPINFAIRDRNSILAGGMMALVLALASFM